MDIVFRDSEEYTLGVEVEVQLIDADTLSLTSTSGDIITSLGGLDGSIKHELMMSNLEIITGVCSSVDEVYNDLMGKFQKVLERAGDFNTLLCCAGTHPFSRWKDQIVTDKHRYRQLLEDLRFIARRFNIFGLHVHTGLKGGERCIYVMNRMLYYLPHLLAISANSPFWEGDDTGLKSYRVKVFESLPIAGLPFYFKNWDDYRNLVRNYIATNTIRTIRELWWDIRPHPDFGTIEVRICDTPSTIKEMVAITALVQALVRRFSDEYTRGVSYRRPHSAIIRENKWRACRYGLDGRFIREDGCSTVDARQAIRELLEGVTEDVKVLGSEGRISHIYDVLDGGNGAERQIRVWKRRGNLRDVVRDMCLRLGEEIKTG